MSRRPHRAPAAAGTHRPGRFTYRATDRRGEYEVYDRATGEHLGRVRRDDSVAAGHAGRWRMATGVRFRDASGRQIHPTAMSETRDGAVDEALAIRAHRRR